jgi:hypothetical protein
LERFTVDDIEPTSLVLGREYGQPRPVRRTTRLSHSSGPKRCVCMKIAPAPVSSQVVSLAMHPSRDLVF